MKYLKLFENIINKPQIGDYVICDEENKNTKLINFISSNIGQIIDGPEPNTNLNVSPGFDIYYTIKYNNYNNIDDLIKSGGLRNMYLIEILYSSPNFEDVEIYMNTKKFNI